MCYYISVVCGCSSMARIPAFQAGRVGSIHFRSKRKSLSSGSFENTGIEPAVRSLAVPVVAALPLATSASASFLLAVSSADARHPTSPITRSIRGVVIVIEKLLFNNTLFFILFRLCCCICSFSVRYYNLSAASQKCNEERSFVCLYPYFNFCTER